MTVEATPALALEDEADGSAGEEFEEQPSFEVDGSAVDSSSIAHTVTPLQVQEPIQPMVRDRQRERGGPNDRGDRGRNDRDRNARPPRIPRGFAPRHSLYGVDSSAEVEESAYGEPVGSIAASGSEPEPLILPGESLSKYRKGGEEASPAKGAVSSFATPVAMPDPGFKVDPSWDGGAMLPGETLSRYRGGAAQPNGGQARSNGDGRRPDGRREERGGRQNERWRDGREVARQASGERHEGETSSVQGDRASYGGSSSAAPMMVPSSVPPPDLQSNGPVSGYSHVDEQTEEIQAHQPDFVHSELPAATAESPSMEDRGLAHQAGEQRHGSLEQIDAAQAADEHSHPSVEQEYEPEGQSVSYRVDPSAPSEYRQSSPAAVEETALVESEPADFGEGVYTQTLGSVSVAGDLPRPIEGDSHDRPAAAFEEEAIAPHEITTVHSSGEMNELS